ncbi:MAG: YifB family Mg chelatase-like AAA ATPase [Chloroflexi bacterium]|nr:YifB family Mg chelatase-like AAA ATPase [Chloroflexota bacterium]
MLAKIISCATVGLEGALIEVEVDISAGLPSLTIVGLPDAAVNESKERVRAAVKNSGLEWPTRRITVNLAPADLRKEGPAYDLPIAVGVLIATEQAWANATETAAFIGELSLDGGLRHTTGILPMVAFLKDKGLQQVFVPAVDAPEAALVQGIEVYPVAHLSELTLHLQGLRRLGPLTCGVDLTAADDAPPYAHDFGDVKGQEHVKRAMEVAAAGNHNVFMMGPPGSGKTLVAQALPSILPSLTVDEALEVTKIYSVAGLLPADQPLIRQRPYRAPHHTISYAGLVGGGHWPRPGEVSLAHRGVLFLDELPEFSQRVLEVLRQPLEARHVVVARSTTTLTFPADFMLVGAANPCPCGYYGDPVRPCTCGPAAVARYQKRISGPLLDRIDIHIEVPRVEYEKLSDERLGEPSSAIRPRVEAARQRQRERFVGTALRCNADMGPAEVRTHCPLTAEGRALLRAAMLQLHMSARAYHRVLKLARTIADLAGAEAIETVHLAEAIQYRPRGQR